MAHETNLAFLLLVGLGSAVFLRRALVTGSMDLLNCDFSFGDCPIHLPADARRVTVVMATVPKRTEEGAISPFSVGSTGLYRITHGDRQNFLNRCNVF